MSAKTLVLGVFSCAVVVFAYPNAPAQETIRIAGIYAVTGAAAPSNASSLQGARLAVKEVNRTGGVLGKPLEMLEIDNLSTPIGSKVAADRAVGMGAVAILGSAWSSHSLAVARVAQKRSIPMVTNVSTHPDVTRVGSFIFRVCFTDIFQARVMAQFARRDLGVGTAVVMQDITSDYSLGLASAFQRSFEAKGGKVLLNIDYKHNQEHFDDMVVRAREAGPESVFIPGYDESGTIIRKARKAGLDCVFLGGDGWETKAMFDRGGRALGNGYFCTHWAEEVGTKESREFVRLYRQEGNGANRPVMAAAALAYDAVMLLADALDRAGTTESRALRKTLARTQGFDGVTGNLSFDRYGDPIKEAVIMELSNGEARYLKRAFPFED